MLCRIFFILLLLRDSLTLNPVNDKDRSIKCRDNYNKTVSWWYLYKPSSELEGFQDRELNFTFVSPNTSGRWVPSNKLLTFDSMLQHTFRPMFDPTYENEIAVLVFEPSSKGTFSGAIIANKYEGVLVHYNLPKFPKLKRYDVAIDATMKKDILFSCLSLDIDQISVITSVLRRLKLKYSYEAVPLGFRQMPAFDFSDDKNTRVIPSSLQFFLSDNSVNHLLEVAIMSRNTGDTRELYERFANQQKIVLDVYGRSKNTQNVCNSVYGVRSAEGISLKYTDVVYYIPEAEDTMSFAVSTAAHWQYQGSGPRQYWVCRSSLEPDDKSGQAGVLICTQNYELWHSFRNLLVKEPNC